MPDNKYLDLLDGNQPGNGDVYGRLIDDDRRQSLQHSMHLAADRQPDAEAKLQQLAKQTGMPVEAIRLNQPEVERAAFIGAIPYAELLDKHATSEFLSNPENAALAKDDIGNLTLFETVINGAKRGWQGLKQQFPTIGLNTNARILANVDKVQARIAAGEHIPDGEDPYGVRFMSPEQIADFKRVSVEAMSSQAVSIAGAEKIKRGIPQPAIVGRVQEASKQGFGAAISAFTDDPVKFVAAVGSESFVQNAPSLAATTAFGLAGRAGMAAATTGAGSFSTDYAGSILEALQKEGVDTADNAALELAAKDPALMARVSKQAFAHASVVAAFDALSGGLAGKTPLPKVVVGNKIANYSARAVIEPNLQGALGALGEAGGAIAAGQEIDPFNILAEYVGEFSQTPGEHGGAAARKLYTEFHAARQAQLNAEVMQSLGDAATNSKLLQRLPEKMREFIANAKKNGPVDSVYIPAEQFNTYFQSAGMDPEEIAGQLGATNYAEALAAGSDVAIPLENYVVHIAPSKHHAGLMQDTRLHAGDMTMREAAEFEKRRDEIMKRFAEETEAQVAPGQASAYNTIRDDLMGQIVDRYDRGTAESYATLYAKAITTMAERSGVDPLELHKRYGLTVKSPLPEALRPGKLADINIDPILERIRKNDRPADSDIYGLSLSEFVRAKGGMRDAGGELRSMDADKGQRPFTRNMINPSSKYDYDRMRELAAEAGYFHMDSYESDLLDRIDEDLRGNRIYADQNLDEQSLGLRQSVDQLEQIIEELGIDLNAMTNEQVRQALEAAAQEYEKQNADGGARYDQPIGETIVVDGVERSTTNSEGKPIADTTAGLEAFWSWFGDSKVVDEQGRPLVVYHGTAFSFDKFSDRQGRGAVFFTPERKFAEEFANDKAASQKELGNSESQNPVLYGVYLSAKNPFDPRSPEHANRLSDETGHEYDQDTIVKGDTEILEQLSGSIKKLGFDGYYESESGSWNIGVFDPEQIKSATGNRGTFDPNDARIMFQPAYHGTPHQFDKFSLEHLGRGEGNQTYGWGLYFAGNKEVAEWYRKTLAKRNQGNSLTDDMRAILIDGKPLVDQFNIEGDAKFAEMAKAGDSFSAWVHADERRERWQELAGDESYQFRDYADAKAKAWSGLVAELGADKKISSKANGQLYEVDIPEDDQMLLWDKPLSQQSDRVKAALDKLGVDGIVSQLQELGVLGAYTKEEIQQLRGEDLYDMLRQANNDDQRAASMALHDAGVSGIKYLDGSSRTAGDGNFNYVIFDDNAVQILNKLYQGDDTKRGFIQFGGDRKFSITLLEKADLSTFLHEMGHFHLEVLGDLATAENAAQGVKDDYATLLKWFGVESRDQIKTEHHEQFARGFEAYLMEGKAPSPELRGMFQRFKAWLTLIYKEISRLNVTLTDDVRGVFDRILASDAEIEAAKNDAGMMAIFSTAKDAGMSEQEFAAYRETVEKASAAAQEALQQKLMAEYARAQKTWFKAERAKVKGEVEADMANDPVYRAFDALVSGKLPDDTPIKLDRGDLISRYGEGYLKNLPRGFARIYASEGGWSVDTAAEALGFAGPDTFIEALANMRPKKAVVEAETDARMREKYGDMRLDGTIADEAIAALHNDERANVIAAELRALKRKEREVAPMVKAAVSEAEKFAERERAYERRWLEAEAKLMAEIDAAKEETKRDELKTKMAEQKAVIEDKVRQLREDAAAAKSEAHKKQLDAWAATHTPPTDAIRDMARGIIGQKQVRDLDPNQYLLAERSSSRKAFQAMANGEHQKAAIEKQRELLNHYLYREAVKARDEIQELSDYAKQLEKRPAQQRLGKAGADYLEQINGLLEQYEFKKVSGTKLDRRAALRTWYDAQVAAGFNPAIDASLLENARQKNFLEVPVDELRAVRDALKSIEHLARLKNRLLGKNAQVDFNDAIEELIGAAEKNTKGAAPRSVDPALKGAKERAGDWFRHWDTNLLPMETVIDWLDGGRADGPWHQYVFNRASDSQTAELDLIKKIGDKVGTLLEEFNLDKKSVLLEAFALPGIGNRSRQWLISVALNVGNQQNYDKLLRGQNLTAAQVDNMLTKLRAEDWQFVQKAWDTINDLWPDIAALEKRVSGVEPPKVEARPYQVKDAAGNVVHEVAGGYYPLVYDPRHSQAGLKQESGPLAGLLETGYSYATSPKGHTKGRTEFAAPLLLDFGHVLQRHISGVVKDLTHREFLIDANRIFNEKKIREVLQQQLGDQYEGMFMPWLKAVANDRNVSPSDGLTGMDKLIESARTNATTMALGFKVTTIVSQIAGAPNAIEIVGAGWFAGGLQRALKHPVESYEMIVTKSGEMRHRFDTIDRDVRDQMRKMRAGNVANWHSAINRAAFMGINVADRMITIPTWLGAYNKAIAGGMDEASAIHQADGAVRRSQGAGGAKDLNDLQRRRGAIKMLTMFYTPFAAQYGRLQTARQQLGMKGMAYMPEAIMRVLLITAIPAVLADLLTGRGPSECAIDDPACYAKWASLKSLFSLSAPVPLLREIGNLAEKQLNGDKPGSRDIRISPIIDMTERASKTVMKGIEIAATEKEADSDFWFDVMENSGYIANLPTGQARITVEYLHDLLTGKTHPEGPGDLLHDMAFRRKKGE